MVGKRLKSLWVAVFSVFALGLPSVAMAQHDETPEHQSDSSPDAHVEKKKGAFDAEEVIFNHVLNAHEFHFLDLPGENGETHPVTLPLPVILYSPERGLTSFMSSKFEHGHAAHEGYRLHEGKVVAVDGAGNIDESVAVYDFSLTRNVVQMFLALAILVWLLLSIARFR